MFDSDPFIMGMHNLPFTPFTLPMPTFPVNPMAPMDFCYQPMPDVQCPNLFENVSFDIHVPAFPSTIMPQPNIPDLSNYSPIQTFLDMISTIPFYCPPIHSTAPLPADTMIDDSHVVDNINHDTPLQRYLDGLEAGFNHEVDTRMAHTPGATREDIYNSIIVDAEKIILSTDNPVAQSIAHDIIAKAQNRLDALT